MSVTPLKGPRIKHDGPLHISTGQSAQSTKWKTEETRWSILVSRLYEPIRTAESVAEYHASPKSAQDRSKDVGGYLKGPASGGRRRSGSVQRLYLMALDIDAPDGDLAGILGALFDFSMVVHSTHSHRPDRPRLRLVAPLSRPCTPDEWQAVARKLSEDIGIDQFDPSTYQAERLNYWPSHPRDGEYVYELIDGPWLDVDAYLGRYDDWRDPSQWPAPSKEGQIRKRHAEKAEDPEAKRGMVGAFCRTYSIESAIDSYLQDAYEPHHVEGRYTYRHGSTAGGLILYEDGKFAYSHHGTDPVGGRLVNAFDLVRIHRFGELDADAKPGTPGAKMPSYAAMVALAGEDVAVRRTVGEERLQRAAEDFGALDFGDAEPLGDARPAPAAKAPAPDPSKAESKPDDGEWLGKLELEDSGKYKPTRDNVLLILENDPLLKDRIKYNIFNNKSRIGGDLPWRKLGERDQWSDHDDSGLRYYLEHVYEIDHAPRVHDAIHVLLERHSFHPVREYLRGLKWDGEPRIETVFIDYLGAADSEYIRAVTRKSLVAAVARVENPGCKYDYMPVLIGPQGVGKSFILKRLGGDWFSDSLTTVQGKEAYEQLLGSWLIEMGELAATRRAETEAIKHFLTKREDTFRAAYARHSATHPRQCVFFGTTNDDSFLKDQTGNRRYWPVKVLEGIPLKSLHDDLTDNVVSQIWAEAVELWRAGEALYLPPGLEAAAALEQASHTEESPYAGVVREFLSRPIPEDWAERDTGARRAYLGGSEFGDESGAVLVQRDAVCVLEVWIEAIGGQRHDLRSGMARELADIIRTTPGWAPCRGSLGRRHIPGYGRQRAFERVTE